MKKLLKKFFDWLFPITSETKEESDKRVAEINSLLNDLDSIDNEIKSKQAKIDYLNKYLR